MRLAYLLFALTAATMAGAASAQDALEQGRERYFAGDYQGALAAWQPLAEEGDPRALYNVAQLYRQGLGVEKDETRAMELLRRSAQKGFAEAQYLLAAANFDAGDAGEARRQEAVGWWIAAARQGHALSQYRLGLLYWNGEAVARDLERGYGWMRLAAEQGVEPAMEALANMRRYLTTEQLASGDRLAETLIETGRTEPRVAATAQEAPVPEAVPVELPQAEEEAAPARREPEAAAQQPSTEPGPREQAAASPPQAPGGDSWRLQLVALQDRSRVAATWERLSQQAADLVGDLAHRIVETDLGARGTYHRLQVGPFASRDAALKRCQALKAAGQDCFPVAPGS